ncbi:MULTISPECIES: NmrA/HSCARG family protein [Sandaracinus]|uniref:NmrA/HSCARG family protein n=1 Tax=Sandaracinus TaxID=1055688 RepID=UPI0019D41888|nr:MULTISPECIES: NmrA/HSCARG family protein [Sandaracinus]QRN75770.1 Oxidoreductase, NmrA-like [Sandaracinus sp.]UJR87279.1 Nucleoside-diphosphate sugar epimerase [Sandaracinus amylolyticus]
MSTSESTNTQGKNAIAVIGATGAQGGGLVRAILADPSRRFTARAITRDPRSERARDLARAGAEVVAADLDDTTGLERAFAGAYGAFCVTSFWDHFSPETEIRQAENMARAARAARVRHVVWSTLEDTRAWVPLDDDRMPTLSGRYKVPHYDGKGEADRVFRGFDVPTTFFRTSFYWDNFIHLGMGPRRGADGALAIALPIGTAKLPGIAAEDIGACALGVLARGPETIGRTVGVAGGHLSGAQMAAGLSAALGETVRFVDLDPAAYRALGFPGADDLGNMFQFKRDFERDYCAARDLEATRALHPGLQSFESWLERNAKRIPVT